MRTYKVTFIDGDKSYDLTVNANGTDAAVETATKRIKAKLKGKLSTHFRYRCEQINTDVRDYSKDV